MNCWEPIKKAIAIVQSTYHQRIYQYFRSFIGEEFPYPSNVKNVQPMKQISTKFFFHFRKNNITHHTCHEYLKTYIQLNS